MEKWNIKKGIELYGIDGWGDLYFHINNSGHVAIKTSPNSKVIDLFEIVETLVQRGTGTPLLLRFDGILKNRLHRIQAAFDGAIKQFSYPSKYGLVFPIKVNPQQQIVDAVWSIGGCSGLEVGSKPELMAVLAQKVESGAVLLCNGHKDREYLELALMARKIGWRTIVIVEQLRELELLMNISQGRDSMCEIGLRIKPITKGVGRWEKSAGDRAKFGLSAGNVLKAIEMLEQYECSDRLSLVHFHIGSQIPSIMAIQKVLRETTQMFTKIAKKCPSVCFFDIGGGLAVDYLGSQTNSHSSMNYTIEEYARDVVYAIFQACKEAEVSPPNIISESGRALLAHHAVLVTEVIDVAKAPEVINNLGPRPSEHKLLRDVDEFTAKLRPDNCHETLNDAFNLRDEQVASFQNRELSLEERAYLDIAFGSLLAKIQNVAKELSRLPEEMKQVFEELRDTYFCNFSVFRSLPDSWAINQLFPIMPIHKLDLMPTRRAILADMSCDSDGQIDSFIGGDKENSYLPVHELKKGEAYYLGIFLVGAYQEVMGGPHNLFGDTNVVHVNLDKDNKLNFSHVVPGDNVREVLQSMHYDTKKLVEGLSQSIDNEIRNGTITAEEGAKIQAGYLEALQSYTYLYVGR